MGGVGVGEEGVRITGEGVSERRGREGSTGGRERRRQGDRRQGERGHLGARGGREAAREEETGREASKGARGRKV